MEWKYLFTSLEGRIGRESYWRGVLAMIIVTFAAAVLDFLLGTNNGEFGIISGLVALALIWPSIALYAKRWHDRGKSGWWTLIVLVPIIGGIWMFVELGCLRGTAGDNQYGRDPLRG